MEGQAQNTEAQHAAQADDALKVQKQAPVVPETQAKTWIPT